MKTLISVVILSTLFSVCLALPANLNSNSLEPYRRNSSASCLRFNPCLRRGRCSVNDAGRYSCQCKPKYRGSRCQFIDYCASNPCNNGVCVQNNYGFSCNCSSEYTGERCNLPDYCVAFSCQNGGTCINDREKARCQCTHQYYGQNCQRLCRSNYRYHCDYGIGCIRGRFGRLDCSCTYHVLHGDTVCIEERDIEDECRKWTNPCNGGRCTNNKYGFSCNNCPKGKSGTRCERVDWCYSSPCMNGGSCSSANGTYTCACQKPYEGKHCELNPEPCTVQCSVSSFSVSCRAQDLPVKVRAATLWSRNPEPSDKCTCQFSVDQDGDASSQPCVLKFNSCGTRSHVVNDSLIYENFLRFDKDDKRRVDELSDDVVTRNSGDFKVFSCLFQLNNALFWPEMHKTVNSTSDCHTNGGDAIVANSIKLECEVPLEITGDGSRLPGIDLDARQQHLLKVASSLPKKALSIKYYGLSSGNNGTLEEISKFQLKGRLYILVFNNNNYANIPDVAGTSLFLSNCYATPTPQSQIRYYLLEKGCPRDKSFKYETALLDNLVNSGVLQANFQTLFSIKPFLFKSGQDDIYVHCKGDLCFTKDCNVCRDNISSNENR